MYICMGTHTYICMYVYTYNAYMHSIHLSSVSLCHLSIGCFISWLRTVEFIQSWKPRNMELFSTLFFLSFYVKVIMMVCISLFTTICIKSLPSVIPASRIHPVQTLASLTKIIGESLQNFPYFLPLQHPLYDLSIEWPFQTSSFYLILSLKIFRALQMHRAVVLEMWSWTIHICVSGNAISWAPPQAHSGSCAGTQPSGFQQVLHMILVHPGLQAKICPRVTSPKLVFLFFLFFQWYFSMYLHMLFPCLEWPFPPGHPRLRFQMKYD